METGRFKRGYATIFSLCEFVIVHDRTQVIRCCGCFPMKLANFLVMEGSSPGISMTHERGIIFFPELRHVQRIYGRFNARYASQTFSLAVSFTKL